jgi:hypothetical protein
LAYCLGESWRAISECGPARVARLVQGSRLLSNVGFTGMW